MFDLAYKISDALMVNLFDEKLEPGQKLILKVRAIKISEIGIYLYFNWDSIVLHTSKGSCITLTEGAYIFQIGESYKLCGIFIDHFDEDKFYGGEFDVLVDKLKN